MDKKIIKKIVDASGVEPGQLVLVHFWGEDKDLAIMHDFCIELATFGCSPIPLQQSRSINYELFSSAKPEAINEKLFGLLDAIDVIFDVFTYRPVVLKESLPKEQMDLYRAYMRSLFEKLMKKNKFIQIRIPTEENAMESELEFADYKKRMCDAYDIDYKKLSADCNAKVNELSKYDNYFLNTPDGCSLSINLKGRQWLIDAGDGDLPCGEVGIAPVENMTNGSVCFNQLYVEDIGLMGKTVIHVEDGRIIDSSNSKFNDFLNELPENGNVVCELGLGMNDNVKSLCGYTLLDEKMAGTFHIAIGANTMFGGKNNSDVHIDLVGTGELKPING